MKRGTKRALIGLVGTAAIGGAVWWGLRKTKELEAGTSLMIDYLPGKLTIHQGNLIVDIGMSVSNTRNTPLQISAISLNGLLINASGKEARVGQMREFFTAPKGLIQGMGMSTIPIRFTSNWMQILGVLAQQVNPTKFVTALSNIFRKPENRTSTQTTTSSNKADFKLEGYLVAAGVRVPINEIIPVTLPV